MPERYSRFRVENDGLARVLSPYERMDDTGPDPIDVVVGQRLRCIRRDRDVSQEELAHALGISFQQVQKYERAANRLSASMLVRAARFLQVHPGEILCPGETGPPTAAPLTMALSTSSDVEELINNYARIRPARWRRMVLLLARTLVAAPADRVPAAESSRVHTPPLEALGECEPEP